ncbi:MAG: zinc ABC transporter substrate-binding protein [Cellulomonadaceae bacterium]|nr:zinc ABC transporter substrate-binding protein [Cellulomonadaceae bacterium]
MLTRHRRAALLAALPATALLLAACSAPTTDTSSDNASTPLTVVTSFYPLQFVAQQVGGNLADISNLTPPAADPHHLELSLAQTRQVGDADVVVTLTGFATAVDEAIEARQPQRVVDAADIVTLLPASVTGDQGHDHDHDHDSESDSHSHNHDSDDHSHDDADDHSHDSASDSYSHSDESDDHDHDSDDSHSLDHAEMGGYDPHFWLDPTLLAQLAQPIADAMADADPANADTFQANAASLVDQLTQLDREFADGLAPFAGAKLVTNHTAFGYLAQRYGLEQVGITGLDHDIEASPARLREIGDIVRANNVTTIFSETLVSPRLVDTLASDLGVGTAVLDTLEGLTQQGIDNGDDYFSLMRANLAALTAGLNTQ